MLDKIDRKLLSLLQSDCTLSLQALADAVNLTTTPCWKRLKRLEDDGILLGRVALLDPEKLGLGLTAFVLIKTQHHSSDWYCRFVSVVTGMPFTFDDGHIIISQLAPFFFHFTFELFPVTADFVFIHNRVLIVR
jgi:DNA-binding Lrp family transcriptional regulator